MVDTIASKSPKNNSLLSHASSVLPDAIPCATDLPSNSRASAKYIEFLSRRKLPLANSTHPYDYPSPLLSEHPQKGLQHLLRGISHHSDIHLDCERSRSSSLDTTFILSSLAPDLKSNRYRQVRRLKSQVYNNSPQVGHDSSELCHLPDHTILCMDFTSFTSKTSVIIGNLVNSSATIRHAYPDT